MRPIRWGLLAGVAPAALLTLLVLRASRMPEEAPGDAVPGPAAVLFDPGPPSAPAPADRPGSPAPSPGPSIAGTVLDRAGRPVAGAEVAAARNGERVPARTSPGADGRFSLSVGSAADEYLVGARAPGMAPVLRGGVRPGSGDLRIVLDPPARLEGLVKDPAGVPCAGARVRARLRFPAVAENLGGFETRADESGRYAFAGFPPVEGSVQAFFHESSSEPAAFVIHPGEESVALDLRVETGPCLEGVVRGADGNPLEGIHVGATDPATSRTRSATTDAEGRFVLRKLDPVTLELHAVDPAALWLEGAPRRITPPERGIEIRMGPNPEPPAYAVFRVVDSAGIAVRAVRTMLFRPGEARPAGSGSLAADGAGVFRTGRLRKGSHRIELRSPAGTGTTGEFAVEHGQVADLGTIRLRASAAVRGRILDSAGAPARSARLFAGDDAFPESGAVAADGSFEVRGLPAGPGRLRILLPGCVPLEVPWQAAAGESADLGDLRLLPATGAFRGSVRSRSGAPVAGARIRISPWDDFGPGSDVRRLLAGPDGRFESASMAAGRWVLSAEPPEEDEEARRAGVAKPATFTSNAVAQRIDLAEGEQREVVLEID